MALCLISPTALTKNTYLSYDEGGWSALRLNCLQRLARKFFGWYKTTHLPYVCRHLDGERHTYSPHHPSVTKMTEQIFGCFAKRYPTKKAPTYVVHVGNAPLNSSQVICFGEDHTDQRFRACTAATITKHYRPGDVVIVEGVLQGLLIDQEQCPQTDGIRRPIKVFGMEPPDWIRELNNEFEKNKDWRLFNLNFTNAIQPLIRACKTLRENADRLSPDQLSQITTDTTTFLQSGLPIVQMIYKQNDKLSHMQGEITAHLNKVKKSTQNYEVVHQAGESYRKWLLDMLEKQSTVFYTHMTRDLITKIGSFAALRNKTLAEQIQAHLRPTNRVFVIMGRAHFISGRALDKIHTVLKKNTSCVFMSHEEYSKVKGDVPSFLQKPQENPSSA